MSDKLLVVADLGRVKAYEFHESAEQGRPSLKLIEDWTTNLTQHLSEELSDRAGQFRKGVANSEGPSALSDGEQHDLDLERRRRAVKSVAEHITELSDAQHPNELYFAADNRINRPILDAIPERIRSKIQNNVSLNLSKLSTEEVLDHFSGKAERS